MTRLNLILCLFIFFSCDSKKDSEGVIPKERMASILIDIHLAEAFTENQKMPLDSTFSYYKGIEAEILKNHSVDSATFFESYNYYSQRVQELDQIYEWVIDTLNSEQASLRAVSE